MRWNFLGEVEAETFATKTFARCTTRHTRRSVCRRGVAAEPDQIYTHKLGSPVLVVAHLSCVEAHPTRTHTRDSPWTVFARLVLLSARDMADGTIFISKLLFDALTQKDTKLKRRIQYLSWRESCSYPHPQQLQRRITSSHQRKSSYIYVNNL